MCSIFTSRAKRAGSGVSAGGGHVCSCAVGVVREQLERVRERRLQHREPVAAPAGRAGEIDDERRTDDARRTAREQPVRRLRDRVRPQRLRDPRRLAVEHVARRLGRDVARREPRAAGREDERAPSRELADRRGDLIALVGNDPPLDVVAVGAQQLLERVAASVLARPGDDPVRDGQHRGLQATGSFVFSTSTTSTMRIPLSTAFAMS